MNIRQFATKVGANTHAIREAAVPFHLAYVKATPEEQGWMRRYWMLGHLEGQGIAQPEVVLERGKGKGASKANIEAIDRASSDFRYHVVKAKTKANKTEPVTVSRAHKAAAMDFLGTFKGETLAEQIKAAIAVLNALK